MAECSESTGTISAPAAAASRITSSPRADERLLIGKGNALFRPDGRERRPQAEHSDNSRHNGVRQRVLCRGDEAVHTGANFNFLPCQRLTQALRGLLRAHHGKLRPEAAALLGHALHILPGSQRSDAHRQLLNDLERLPPDGAGRTEDRQIFCHHITSPQTG